MNEEIKQLIEEEAEKCAININYRNLPEYLDVMHLIESFKEGANFIHSKCQEAERWRKVEEEPDNQDIVLVKTDKECFATAYYHGKNSGWVVYGDEAYKQFGNIVEWKPIS